MRISDYLHKRVQHCTITLRIYEIASNLAVASGTDSQGTPAPFTYQRTEDDILLHYLDLSKIRAAPREFAQLAVDGIDIAVDGTKLVPELVAVRIHPALQQPPFASVNEAKSALAGDVYSYPDEEIYVGETVTDVSLLYQHEGAIDSYTISSSLKPGLAGQDQTANLILDHFPGSTRVNRLTGLLDQPVVISNSGLAAASSFVVQGVVHILNGLDHVLFVLCLAIGAAGFGGLLWRVTGFTIGHTITLIAGFLGYVPTGNWFIPLVETGIALSIIYAAVIAPRTANLSKDSLGVLAVTFLIGLLHGLGFSFVLHEILLPNSAHMWKVLLSFNIGVEIGQIVIVTAAWIVLWVIARINTSYLNPSRWIVAIPCIGLASFWVVERIQVLSRTLLGG